MSYENTSPALSKTSLLKGKQCPKALYLTKNPPTIEIEPDPIHFEYLAEPCKDPRRELAEKLLSEIPSDACVLTYNQTFEKGVFKDLAAAFPDLADEINVRIENIRDLMVPFRKRDVYRWQMQGSYSIKEVLPALVPELSYAGLDVSDGMMAMRAYNEMCAIDDPAKLEELRQGLSDYF